jgi:type I protein arginine methyltransferase
MQYRQCSSDHVSVYTVYADCSLGDSQIARGIHSHAFITPSHSNITSYSCTFSYSAMSDWQDFQDTTHQVYGVDMGILANEFDREQKEYYLLSSRWTELPSEAVLAEPAMVKHLDMITCTLQDARGITADDARSYFDFDVDGSHVSGPISGVTGWFTADFRSRSDAGGSEAPKLSHPSFLSTGPENGYTHWGQQSFYFSSGLPLFKGEITRLWGSIEMMRTKENARLYNCRISYQTSRRRSEEAKDGQLLMKSHTTTQVYQIP